VEEFEALKTRSDTEDTVDPGEPAGSSDLSKKQHPVHVKLFGRSHHRIDSYSIHTGQSLTSSHIYISDADTVEQVK
jgi:hypothetical protein